VRSLTRHPYRKQRCRGGSCHESYRNALFRKEPPFAIDLPMVSALVGPDFPLPRSGKPRGNALSLSAVHLLQLTRFREILRTR
jgi:hypothetical protein